MNDENEFFDVTVKALTAKAVLVLLEDTGGEQWIPLSCVDLDETNVNLERGASGEMAIKSWFAKKEGL